MKLNRSEGKQSEVKYLKYVWLFSILIGVVSPQLLAQKKELAYPSPYKVHRKIEIPVTVFGMGLFYYQQGKLDSYSALTEAQVPTYHKSDVSDFDSWAFRFSESGYENARRESDMLLGVAGLAPALLLIDNRIKAHWIDYLTLYFEAQTAQSMVYLGTVYAHSKARPFVYNQDLTLHERAGTNRTNSFFSGHTSATATASFFMAKVYCDFHRPKGWQQALIYTAAAIPPSVMGMYRMAAGKHFPSDVIVGGLVGAASGFLVPQFHKIKPKGLSMIPVYNEGFKGMSFKLKF